MAKSTNKKNIKSQKVNSSLKESAYINKENSINDSNIFDIQKYMQHLCCVSSEPCPLYDQNMNFPPNFPKLSNYVAAIGVTEHSYGSLRQDKKKDVWIEDGVVNGFFAILKSLAKKRGMDIFCIPTEFSSPLLNVKKISPGFVSYAEKKRLLASDLILYPVNDGGFTHWILMLIIPKKIHYKF